MPPLEQLASLKKFLKAPSQSVLGSMAPFPPVSVVENGNSSTDVLSAGGVGKVGGRRAAIERLVMATSNRIRTFLAMNWPTAERKTFDVVAETSLAPSSANETPGPAAVPVRSSTVAVPALTSTRTAMARAPRPVGTSGGSG